MTHDFQLAALSVYDNVTRFSKVADEEEMAKRRLVEKIEAPRSEGDPKPTWEQFFNAEAEDQFPSAQRVYFLSKQRCKLKQ